MRSVAMRRLARTLLLGSLSVMSHAHAATACETDAALVDNGFQIHEAARFEHMAGEVLARFSKRGDELVYDTWGPIRSLYGPDPEASLKLYSYDDVATPQSERYGDVVLIFAFDPEGHDRPDDLPWTRVASRTPQPRVNRLIEVRWWENGARHAAYDASRVRCASHSIPMAFNTLF